MDTTDLTWAEHACRGSGTLVALALQIGFALTLLLVWALCFGLL